MPPPVREKREGWSQPPLAQECKDFGKLLRGDLFPPPQCKERELAWAVEGQRASRRGGPSGESRPLVSGPSLAPWDMQDSAVDAMEAALGTES